MSLINDMLKDLDRDQPGSEPPLPAGLVARKRETSAGLRRYLLPGVALLAIVYALLIEWNVLGIMPDKTSAAAEIPQPIAINSKWLTQPVPVIDTPERAPTPVESVVPAEEQATVAEGYAAAAEEHATDAVTPPAEESHADAVQQLLAAAAQALAANRLTTPVGDNAYQLYSSVLVIDPTNLAAHSGIESIRQRYLQWLDEALREQRTAAARLFWQKAKSVGVDTAALEALAGDTFLLDAVTDEAGALASYQTADTQTGENSPATSTPHAAAKITPAKMPNDDYVAERLRREGWRGEQDALRLLARVPGAPQTVVALTDLYVERRSLTDLRRLADTLTDQPVGAYVLAQLLVLDGQEQRALDVLAGAELSGFAEQQRVRLLAGLRQKAGDYAAAMELYAALVSASPDTVGDWLGLAVSADKAKLTGTALNAYEKVLLLGHPDQRVMQYARQRRQDLSFAAMNNR